MTVDPRYGLWLSLIAAVGSVLVLCGTEFTTLFGAVSEAKILAALGILNAIINAANGVLHMIPSKAGAANEFPLGPKA